MRAHIPRFRLDPRTRRRLSQVLLSMVAALVVLFVLDIPKLIDEMPRIFVSRFMQRPVSGNIVLVTTDREGGKRDSVAERQAAAIAGLDRMNPKLIVLEGRFPDDDPGIPALREAVLRAKTPIIAVWPATAGQITAQETQYKLSAAQGTLSISRNADLPVDGEAVDANRTSLTGFVFEVADYVDTSEGALPTLGTALVDANAAPAAAYPIDFRFAPGSIPTVSLDSIEQGTVRPSSIQEKRILLAAPQSGNSTLLNSPLNKSLPSAIVGIIAAETLMAKSLLPIGWHYPFVAFGLLLWATAFLPKRARRVTYAMIVAASLAAPVVAAEFDRLLPTGMVYTLLAIYAAIRARSNWRERAAGIDAISGLANFHTLQEDFVKSSGRLVVARVEHFEEVLASLESSLHGSFSQQISHRLASGIDTRIYTDATGHFAWFDDIEHAKSHIAGLLALAGAPLRIGNRTIDFSCAFGLLDMDIAKPRQAISATIVAAETALKRASRIALVSEQGGSDTDWQLSLHSSLDHAIAHQHIYLLFQPQCLLESGHVVGAEALVRWKHPQRGEISPSEFIPFIEKAGRLKPLTAHTLRLAARSANVALNAGARISVNISATLLAEHDFVALICDNVAAGGGRPQAITIEITETAKIEDFRTAARNLERLRDKGFHVSLDDFGTGEANLSLLVGLPCDEIKIDRSFVALAQHNERARIVIRALNDTARKAGMRLVAEGIETETEQDLLISLGCVIGQGFLFGRPMRISELLSLLDVRENCEPRKLTLS